MAIRRAPSRSTEGRTAYGGFHWLRRGLCSAVRLLIAIAFLGSTARASIIPSLEPYTIAGITVGGGNVWVTLDGGGVAKIAPSGAVTRYTLDVAGPIAYGSDGNFWVQYPGLGQVYKVTPAGALTQVGSFAGPRYSGEIIAGPDDALWTVGDGTLSSIALNGQSTSYQVPLPPWLATGPGLPSLDEVVSDASATSLWAIAQGIGAAAVLELSPQGEILRSIKVPQALGLLVTKRYIWSYGNARIERIDPATGTYRSFALPPVSTANRYVNPFFDSIAVGPDGNIWFTYGNQLGRVTATGRVTLITPPLPEIYSSHTLGALVTNAGKLWITVNQVMLRGQSPDGGGLVTYTPTRFACTVPRLRGKTLTAASSAVRRGRCQLDPITRPQHPRCAKKELVVARQSPRPGAKELGLSDIAITVACRAHHHQPG